MLLLQWEYGEMQCFSGKNTEGLPKPSSNWLPETINVLLFIKRQNFYAKHLYFLSIISRMGVTVHIFNPFNIHHHTLHHQTASSKVTAKSYIIPQTAELRQAEHFVRLLTSTCCNIFICNRIKEIF
jgi:hypothetical protein